MGDQLRLHRYRISGLRVESEAELPGVGALSEKGVPDVTIRMGAVPAALADATAKGPTWEIAPGHFLLRIDGIARFLLREGRQITCDLDFGATAEDAAVFLLGTAFGILLHQRRQTVLHASAVRVGHKAVLFCGASGAGKSTIAAALGQRGYPLLNDDVCAISIHEAVPMVHPDGRKLKLWAEAVKELDLAARRGAAVRNKLAKYYVEPEHVFNDAVPIGAIYALQEARPPEVAGIVQPNVVDGALIIQRNAYRPLLVDKMGLKANYFEAAVAIARMAGVYQLTRDVRFSEMPTVLAWLDTHWRETGLLDTAA